MNKFGVMAMIAGFALSSGTMAEQTMTKDVYKAEKERIKDDYKADKARCGSSPETPRISVLLKRKARKTPRRPILKPGINLPRKAATKQLSPRRKLITGWPRKNVTIRPAMRKMSA